MSDSNTFSCSTQLPGNVTYFQLSPALHRWRLCPGAGSQPVPPVPPAAGSRSSGPEIPLLLSPGSSPQPGTLLWVTSRCLFSLVLLLPGRKNTWHQPQEITNQRALPEGETTEKQTLIPTSNNFLSVSYFCQLFLFRSILHIFSMQRKRSYKSLQTNSINKSENAQNQLQCQTNPTKFCLQSQFHLSGTQKTVGEICLYLYPAGHHPSRFAPLPLECLLCCKRMWCFHTTPTEEWGSACSEVWA